MDDAQKNQQNSIPVAPAVSSIAKEVERPTVVANSIPEVELDKEVKEAGVEVPDSPDLVPHEIIKANVQIPNPVVLRTPEPVLPLSSHPVKILKRRAINKNPTLGVTWGEEIEIREDSKIAA